MALALGVWASRKLAAAPSAQASGLTHGEQLAIIITASIVGFIVLALIVAKLVEDIVRKDDGRKKACRPVINFFQH